MPPPSRDGAGQHQESLFPVGDLIPEAEPAALSQDAARLLDVREIHAEPEAAASPRGRQILARFPQARLIEVDSHWRIPHLHGNQATPSAGSG